MAVSESQLKKMVSKVRPRRARPPARTHGSLRRPAGPGPPQPRQPPRRAGHLSPARGRLCSPSSDVPVALCRSPDTGPGKVGSGGSQQRREAEAACHPCSPLFGLSLEQSGGQRSFHFTFYKHKEGIVLYSRSGAILPNSCPNIRVRQSPPFLLVPRGCVLLGFVFLTRSMSNYWLN